MDGVIKEYENSLRNQPNYSGPPYGVIAKIQEVA